MNLTGLEDSTTYHFQVSSADAAGNTVSSSDGTFTTLPPNQPPVAEAQSVSASEDSALVIDLAGTDPDGDPLSFSVGTIPVHGTLSSVVDNQVTYTPSANYAGPDGFTFRAYDGKDFSQPAAVSITVSAVNDPPVANDDAAVTFQGVSVVIPVLDNDSDLDGDALAIASATPATSGTLFLNANQTVTYRPNVGFSGQDSFTYTVTDGQATDTASVVVTVTEPILFYDGFESGNFTAGGWAVTGQASVDTSAASVGVYGALLKKSASITKVIDCGTAVLIDLTYRRQTLNLAANEFFRAEWSSDGITWVILEQANGIVSWGSPSFEVTLGGPSLHLRFSIVGSTTADRVMLDEVKVTAVIANTAPLAFPDSYAADEDTPLAVPARGVLDNDLDDEGDPLSAVLVAPAAAGALSLNPDGSFAYTPNANFHGTDSFTYVANDGLANSEIMTVTITVSPVNDQPTANSQNISTPEDTPLGITLTGSDVDGDLLSFTVLSGPSHGSLGGAAPNLTYTPTADFNGSDSFTYSVSDGQGGTATGTVTVTVTPVNDGPVAGADVVTVEEGGVGAVAVLGNDADVDGGTLTVTGVMPGASGSVTIGESGTVTYSHDGSETTLDSFTYTVSDGQGGTATGTVTVTVTPVNDAPVAGADVVTVDEGGVGAVAVLGNDADVDGGTLTVTGVTPGASGSVTIGENGTVTYSHDGSETTLDSFTYTVSDGQGGTASGTVTVTVTPVNDAPVAGADGLTVEEGGVGTVAVLGNDADVDGGTLTVTGVTPGASGSVALNVDGTVTYSHNGSETTSDSFNYTVSDGQGGTATGTVTVTVTPVNDAPVAGADGLTVDEGGVGTVAVLGNDADADGGTLTVTGVTPGASGSVTIGENGTVTYSHDGSETTLDSFTYTVSDGQGGTASGTVTVTVTPVNDAPVAGADGLTVEEGGVGTVAVLGNDADVDGGTLTVTGVTPGASGSVTIGENGTVTYSHDGSETTLDSFTYTVSDGQGGTATGTVTVTVTPVNDGPVAGADVVTVDEGGVGTVAVLGNDADADGGTLTVTGVTPGASGSVTIGENGTVTYSHDGSETTLDSFTYTVSDGQGGTASGTVTVTVTPVNDAPVAGADGLTVDEGGVGTVAVLGNDADVDGGTLTVTGVTPGASGSVTIGENGTVTYSHDGSETTLDSFTYTVSDGQGGAQRPGR